MAHDNLHAPWRLAYIRSLNEQADTGECFLCAAASASDDRQRKERLVLWTTDHTVVLLNLFPYTNGHLLIAPRAHKAELEELTDEESEDLQRQTTQTVRLLKQAVSPQGFNIGINLGRAAGAGLPGHVHQHVVPRWGGDTNFITVVGEVRVVPHAVSQLYDELIRVHAQMTGPGR
ncbi:MAG: HIT family protein [Tepidisphaeraceae bacterium]